MTNLGIGTRTVIDKNEDSRTVKFSLPLDWIALTTVNPAAGQVAASDVLFPDALVQRREAAS